LIVKPASTAACLEEIDAQVERALDECPAILLAQGARPKVRFAPDSPLEQSGFEPLVPLTLDGTKATEKG
jgi:hypothetical protein